MNNFDNQNNLGSYETSIKAIHTLKDYIDSKASTDADVLAQELSKLGRTLIKAHPNMIAVRRRVTSIVYYIKRMVKSNKDVTEIKKSVLEKIEEIRNEADEKQHRIGKSGSKLIFNHNKILTISYSTNVKEILASAHQLKRKFEVYCLESRPKLEGYRMAEELAEQGIQCHIITDASMAQIAKEVNLIITGADRIFESGFVNKTGTYPLAIIANLHKVPFYVASETDKILKEIEYSVRFYPQEPKEVYAGSDHNIQVSNFYYEIIPFDYVLKIVTEEGVFDINEFINWFLKD